MEQGILHVRSLDMCWHSSSAEHPALDFTHRFDQRYKLFFSGRGGHKKRTMVLLCERVLSLTIAVIRPISIFDIRFFPCIKISIPLRSSIESSLSNQQIDEQEGARLITIDSKFSKSVIDCEAIYKPVVIDSSIVSLKSTHAGPTAIVTDIIIIAVHKPVIFLGLWYVSSTNDFHIFISHSNTHL